jgi:hypothetical protein
VAPTPFLSKSQRAVDAIVRRCDEARALKLASVATDRENTVAQTPPDTHR